SRWNALADDLANGLIAYGAAIVPLPFIAELIHRMNAEGFKQGENPVLRGMQLVVAACIRQIPSQRAGGFVERHALVCGRISLHQHEFAVSLHAWTRKHFAALKAKERRFARRPVN